MTVRRHGDKKDLPSKWFKLKAMRRATSDFSRQNLIGKSYYSWVYQGELPDGTPVAIKTIRADLEEAVGREFDVHRWIRQDSHPNVRQLLAVSYDSEEPLIVYEYLPGGSLREHLQGNRGDYLKNYAFARLNVAIDVASALRQLHYDSDFPIYHRDVKSANVLLDDKHRAKLADMGIAVVVYKDADLDTEVAGSEGYKCPVYMKTGRLDDKSDVYSFGVLLMELATCLIATFEKKGEKMFAEWVVDEMRGGVADELIEPGKFYGGRPLMKAMLWLAERCCSENLSSRPRIDEVEDELRCMCNTHSKNTSGACLANQVGIPRDDYQNTLYGLEHMSLNQVAVHQEFHRGYFYCPRGYY